MRTLSVVLLVAWLMIFGAINATWIGMTPTNFGVFTFIIGLAILILEFFILADERHWFKRTA